MPIKVQQAVWLMQWRPRLAHLVLQRIHLRALQSARVSGDKIPAHRSAAPSEESPAHHRQQILAQGQLGLLRASKAQRQCRMPRQWQWLHMTLTPMAVQAFMQ
jgi:hypothetical protein